MTGAREFLESVYKANKDENEHIGGDSTATVEAINGNTLIVRIGGEENPREKGYYYLASYSPTVGDRVFLLRHGDSYLILGKIK